MLVKKLRRIVGMQLGARTQSLQTLAIQSPLIRRMFIWPGAKLSAGKFARKVTGKFAGDSPAIGPQPNHRNTHRTSVAVRQHTQDVRGCPSSHTERPWLSISTHISTLVLGLSTLALPVDCSGDFGPRGLSFQYTQDVRGFPPAHTRRPWLSVGVCQNTQDVCDCPSAHTQNICGLSISTHISTLALPVDCSGDFGPRGLSVQYTQDICGCPSAHTGRPWLSVSTHWTSVDCPSVHISARWPFTLTVCDFGPRGLSVQYTHDVRVCPSAHTGRPCVSVSTHRTSVCVRQHTQDVCGCPSAHKERSWLSISTHISTLVLGLSTLVLPVDYSGDFGPRRLSVQYTQDVRGCPSAHTGRPWLSVSTHRASVDCPSVHISARLALPVDCSGDFGPRGLSVNYSQDLCGCPSAHTGHRGCPSAHTGRPWPIHQYTYQHAGPSRVLFSTQDVRGLSISTHISTLTLPVDCPGDFGPRGLSVQYTLDVRVCPWVSVCTHRTSVTVNQHTQYDVCGCPWVSVSTHKMFVPVRQHTQDNRGLPISTHISTLVLGLSMLALPVDCSGDFGPHGLFVQYTQDVRGCPPAHTGRPWLPVGVRQHTHDVCGCLSAHTGHPWTVNQYTYQHAGPWAQHAGPWAQHAGPWAQHAGANELDLVQETSDPGQPLTISGMTTQKKKRVPVEASPRMAAYGPFKIQTGCPRVIENFRVPMKSPGLEQVSSGPGKGKPPRVRSIFKKTTSLNPRPQGQETYRFYRKDFRVQGLESNSGPQGLEPMGTLRRDLRVPTLFILSKRSQGPQKRFNPTRPMRSDHLKVQRF
ncbi:hypothetical protein F2Q68_00033612 [Brassica cretica]|uniref:Uncharacterized protein n=1 Tax=Brassica cretica TaxID=69181 RepID=A0A8S9H7B6_BRACR|nr:hypothetical protein F2Q68_00033612 [Brassica cretica]